MIAKTVITAASAKVISRREYISLLLQVFRAIRESPLRIKTPKHAVRESLRTSYPRLERMIGDRLGPQPSVVSGSPC